MKVDIHEYDKRFECMVKQIKKSELSERNKELIFKFYEDKTLDNVGKPRLIRCMEMLRVIAKEMKKDFDKVTKDDIKVFVSKIQLREDYSVWTKQGYKIMIRCFYKWLKGDSEEYPEEVKWIKTNVKRKDIKLPGQGDLLTEDDIKKLIHVADHPRDKALVSMLYESGCRVGEIGNLQIKNVRFDEYGILLVVVGKTGSRQLRIISSVPYLATWVKNHPKRDDKEYPLWVCIGSKNHHEPMRYKTISTCLKKLFERAKINKRYNPHIFRHSRATYLANHLTEFQMNQYFGWVQGSSMPSTYVHLSGKEVENTLLEINGIEVKKEKKESILKPKICSMCATINSYDSESCRECCVILNRPVEVTIQSNS